MQLAFGLLRRPCKHLPLVLLLKLVVIVVPRGQFFEQLLDTEFVDEHQGPFEPWYHLALVKGMESSLSEVKPFQSVDMQPPGRFELNDVEFPVFVEELWV